MNTTVTEETKLKHYVKLLTIKQLQIKSLLEVSEAINNNFSVAALFRIYEFILRAQMGINGLLVFVKNETWTCACAPGIPHELKTKINVEADLISFKSITMLKNFKNENLNFFDILIPVYHKNIPLAYVLIDDLKADETDTIEEKLKFIQTITNIVMVAVENKRLVNNLIEQEGLKKELEIAAQVQAMLIPTELPNDINIEVAAIYEPHHEIGGDYYDFLKISDNEIAFSIGDISGKGIGAALLMANFQGYLRSQVLEETNLKIFIENLNDKVGSITKGEKFITLFFAIFNFKNRKLTYINAGHNPPLILNKNKINQLTIGCTLLGMFDDLPEVNVGEEILDKGAVLINFTDGLIDFTNEKGEFFSLERLIYFFEVNHHLPIIEFNQKLMNYVNEFKGNNPFVDDITILSARFH